MDEIYELEILHTKSWVEQEIFMTVFELTRNIEHTF